MSKITRRIVVQGGLAAAAVITAPAIVRGQSKPSAARTVRAVFHGDIPTYDPIWTTANMSAYAGGMVYDTLFGIDGDQKPQPQMVSKWGVSDDKLTWTFELRDGLKWTDGTAVTTADVVPSLKRWAARDGGGQHMMLRVSCPAAGSS
jgi:peptide/nickel transport system substrate-binding protein